MTGKNIYQLLKEYIDFQMIDLKTLSVSWDDEIPDLEIKNLRVSDKGYLIVLDEKKKRQLRDYLPYEKYCKI